MGAFYTDGSTQKDVQIEKKIISEKESEKDNSMNMTKEDGDKQSELIMSDEYSILYVDKERRLDEESKRGHLVKI